LTQERGWYDAMSLRDENWEQRPEQFKQLQSVLTKDFRAITGWDELLDADQFLSIRSSIRLNKYVLSEPQLIRVNDDAAILTYKVEEQVANRGGGYNTAARVSVTWKRQDGGWLAAYYQSTKVSNSGSFAQR